MSIGLSGSQVRGTIARLVEFFDRWWEKATPLSSIKKDSKEESHTMAQPEYVVFRGRPNWGIAQVQAEGESADPFGQEQWLAVSDISPGNPERRVARVRVPDSFIRSIQPEPWMPPAAQVSASALSIEHTEEHFRRLAAYWLQAENRQGQLDSLPVLQLRHQTSLVEYLSRPRRAEGGVDCGRGRARQNGRTRASAGPTKSGQSEVTDSLCDPWWVGYQRRRRIQEHGAGGLVGCSQTVRWMSRSTPPRAYGEGGPMTLGSLHRCIDSDWSPTRICN